MDLNKNNHEKIDLLIARFLSYKASPNECEELMEWVRQNDEHRNYFTQMTNVWHVAHPAFDPREIDVQKAKNRFMKRTNAKVFVFRRILTVAQRVAAVLFLPLLLLYGIQFYTQSSIAEKEAFQEVISPLGARTEVSLPDGSKVCLNSGSRLKYPVAFAVGERRVKLEGEGYFEVESSPEHPFIVETEELNVRATGTAFNVSAFASDSIVSVALVHGKVAVFGTQQQKTHMYPNTLLEHNKRSGRTSLKNIDTYKWSAWKDGILVFRNERLDEVFKRLNQVYNVKIDIDDDKVRAMELYATFEGEPLEQVLAMLKKTIGVKYQRIPKTVDASGRVVPERIIVKHK